MKKILFFLVVIPIIFSSTVFAGNFNSGSTGTLGAFNPTTNTEVELPADGILNYTTVNIPSGVTVTFKKNSVNTPIYMLATGDVTISGTISVNGTEGSVVSSGRGGTGGYDGGLGGTIVSQVGGKGLGPGGGSPGIRSSNHGNGGDGGSFGTGGTTYGNERIIPMIGGSGGGGGASWTSNEGNGGGGGGGAILIASSGTITITGSLTANGGKGAGCSYWYTGCGGGGSGGAIKLIANIITGNGTISAAGGSGGGAHYTCGAAGSGGNGRIRLEANTMTRTASTSPAYSFGYPTTVFVANTPTLKITSIAGVNIPENPSGTYGSPDITLPSSTTNPVSVSVSATNIPVSTAVTVTSVPEYGNSVSATATLSGTDASSTGTAQITLSTTYQCILMAQATFTIQTAMYYEGEKIEKVRVAAMMGRGSEVTYITESGKEIPSGKLMASVK